MKKIALEEHFIAPGFEEYCEPTVADLDRGVYEQILTRLRDFGDLRLEAMNKAGIERSVLSVTTPGVQIERDATVACRKACQANDMLAREIQKRPDRYSGFAHLPMQAPVAAADELRRCVQDLGFCGALINGHTNGRYLDDPMFYPFWERAETIGTPIYLHPADPVGVYPAMAGCDSLKHAMWEWGMETGTHALRLVFNGIFDLFPKLTLILGHMGETLPFLLWRFDSRARIYGLNLKRRPSEYIRDHIVVTTSGMFSNEPMLCTINSLGAGRVLFSVDYPYESSEEAGRFIDNAPLDNDTRAAVCFHNAARVLRLGRS